MSNTRRLFGFLIALPIALLGIGAWQWQRSGPPDPALQEARRAVEVRIGITKQLATDSPFTMLRIAGDSMRYAPAAALPKLADEAARLDRAMLMANALRYFPPVAVGAATLALLIGLGGVLVIRRAADSAVRSRDALIDGFDRARRRLPFIVTGVTVGLAVAIAAELCYEAVNLWTGGTPGRGMARVTLFLGLTAFGILLVMVKALLALPRAFAIYSPEPMPLPARDASRTDAPGLWAWVDALAARAGTQPPDHVVTGVSDSFFVTSNPVALLPGGPVLTGRTLHLPLTEMALLDEHESAAIIGHELGHFSGDDTAYSLRFSPIYAGLARSLDSVAHAGTTQQGTMELLLLPAWELGTWSMQRFHEAVMHWSRVREFAADQMSVTVASRGAAVSALVRTLAAFKPLATLHGAIRTNPATAPADMVQAIRDIAARDGFGDPTEHLAVRLAHPTDSHPPTSERITALGETLPLSGAIQASAARPVDAAPPVWFASLFADHAAVGAQLTRDYVQMVAKQEADRDAELDAVAALATGTRVLTERTGRTQLLLGGLGIALVPIGALLFTPAPLRDGLLGAGLCLAGVACLIGAWYYWRRGRAPFMTLTPDGFQLHGATTLLPWSAVYDLGISQVQQIVTFEFLLVDGPPPQLESAHFRRVRYKAKSHTLLLAVAGAEGMKHDALIALVADYFRAGQARAIRAARHDARLASASVAG
jgi:Zn-dependent protease with chaperone function